MPHYVCTGSCHEETNSPGICEAQFCTKEGQPLVACSCTDGMHANAGEKPTEGDDFTY